MIQINTSNYSQLVFSTSTPQANFEFFTASGTIVPAWIESYTSPTLTVWVNIANGIAANSTATIYLGIGTSSVNFLSSSGTSGIGMAPELGPTYAQYDNGTSVFPFYDNFAGTSLNTNIWNVISGFTYTVNNGFTYSNGNAIYITSITAFTNPYVIDFMASGQSGVNNGIYWGAQGRGTSANANLWAQRGSSYVTQNDNLFTANPAPSSYTQYDSFNISFPTTNYYVFTLYVGPNNNPIITQTNYTTTLNATNFPNTYLNGYISPRYGGGGSESWQWIRTRAYPPSGTMPDPTFGDTIKFRYGIQISDNVKFRYGLQINPNIEFRYGLQVVSNFNFNNYL